MPLCAHYLAGDDDCISCMRPPQQAICGSQNIVQLMFSYDQYWLGKTVMLRMRMGQMVESMQCMCGVRWICVYSKNTMISCHWMENLTHCIQRALVPDAHVNMLRCMSR